MFTKIDVTAVIGAHFATLKDTAQERMSRIQLGEFLGLPLIFAIALAYLRVNVPGVAVAALLAAAAVFGGLLFNLLVVMFDVAEREPPAHVSGGAWRTFLVELNANVAFSVLATLAMTALLVVLAVVNTDSGIAIRLVSFIFWYVCGLFVLTLLMIVKRVNVVFTSQLKVEG
jgi:hypothetical protein